VQYADFSAWQRSCLTGRRLDDDIRFWRQQLEGAAPLDLPTNRPRPSRMSGRGSEETIDLPAELTSALQALGRRENATLFMTLLAGFSALLSRYARQTDIIVGAPIAGRTVPQVEPLIGFFVNMLPVRTDLSGAPSFRELLGRVRTTALAAFSHQELPFEKMVELEPERDPSRSPIFQVVFSLQNAPPPDLRFADVTLTPVRLHNPTTRFDLEMHVLEHQGALLVRVNYSTDLFDAWTIRHMLGAFRVLLESFVRDPDAPAAAAGAVDEDTRQRIARWNQTTSPYPRDKTVHRLFESVARARPDAPALAFADRALTYQELNAEANRLARHLRSLGVGAGSFVGFCLERSTRTIVTMLAILKAGGVYVPLDPDYPADRLRFMVEDTSLPVVVTERALTALVGSATARAIVLDGDWPSMSGDYGSDDLEIDGEATDLAYLIYTSGSTGQPKGVCVRHRGVVRLVVGANYVQVTREDVVAQGSSSSFDAATFEVWGALLNGARLVGFSQQEMLSPMVLAARLAREHVSILWLTSALFSAVAREAPHALSGLRAVLTGGDKVDPRSVRTVLAQGGPVQVFNGYGPTETTTFAASCRLDTVDEAAASVPIGRGISQTRLHVLDEACHPAPIGMPGELYIAGDGVAAGYWNRPALTAERFVSLPAIDAGTLYRTGDLVRWNDEGQVEFIGRTDGQVKLRGFRVELGEIEARLRAHPLVEDVAVVARDEDGDRRLVAYIVRGSGAIVSWDELRASLRDQLPEYMVPSAFVALDQLPLNANGKLERSRLPAPAAERIANATVVMPRSALESAIAAVWRDVLKIDEISVEDQFFDLGGHSLLLIRVRARLVESIGRDVPMLDLFEYPTIASLARHLATGDAVPAAPGRQLEAAPERAGRTRQSIAVIGMAGRFPGARDLEQFWVNLRDGVESIRTFSDAELLAAGIAPDLVSNPRYIRSRGVLDDVEWFDAGLFGYTPREAELMDPQHRVFLECAWEALERAGYDPEQYRGAIGVMAGANLNTYVGNLLSNAEALASVGGVQSLISVAGDFLATRVSYKLNLRGPSLTVQSACSTSLAAVQLACRSLSTGDCDLALAGGVSVSVPYIRGHLYAEGGIASPDGHCRAFDSEAQGTVPGNGVGIVVLKRLDDALRDGDDIQAVIIGAALNNDGARKVGYTAPSAEGQADVVARAHADAGITADTIGYIEAHGTGTPLGDPIEIRALTQVFGRGPGKTCAIGSLKTNVGHLDSAAGVAGLIKTVLALRHREIPPSLHFERPNPAIDFAMSPFEVNARLREWPSGRTPRRAGVSSFGIGGTNAHVVVEEAPAIEEPRGGRTSHLLTLSARTAEALRSLSLALARVLERRDLPLADVAFTLHVGRRGLAHRRSIVCGTRESAVHELRTEAATSPAVGQPFCSFMFTGQGSQSIGMFGELYREEPSFRADVDSCCEQLVAHLGCDLRDVLFGTGDEALRTHELQQTRLAQPALFAMEYALARLWMRWGVMPDAMIGHSIGEYVAACLSGVLSLDAALRVVAARGRLMQALPPGGMLAVVIPEQDLLALLPADLSVAAVNGPALCVVSGPDAALARFEGVLERRGMSGRRLRTSHAFHSAMMDPMLGELEALLRTETLAPPAIPFVSNVSGTWITDEEATSPAYWTRHVRAAVRFADGVGLLASQPSSVLLEVGPGEVLATLARQQRVSPAPTVIASQPRRSDTSDVAAMLAALGRLWTAGVKVDWQEFHREERRHRVLLPTYPFERERYWIERKTAPDPLVPRRLDPVDWLFVPSWKPAPSSARLVRAAADRAQRWLFFADEAGLAARIAGRVRDLGHRAVMVSAGSGFARPAADAFEIDPGSADDYRMLVEALNASGGPPDVVAHAWGVTRDLPGDPNSTNQSLERGFYSLVWLEQAHGHQVGGARRLGVQSSQAQAIGDCEAV
jgi:amino acid adenylation domain-containing protein